ncbi:ribosome-recycling factor [Acidiphilium sp. 34-64-41]|uniref:ribosome-recycling factor n=1 Tax=Acidiphilium sp. 34-64-41 TaxID=1970297 RepID=UPI000BD0B4B2|nr:ribosome-recycling factor [Acidiphilium sp. 34-64-41]OZB23487.1 MAG: ribosome recycling factor [Acidiphilium sp. 34-64-41]
MPTDLESISADLSRRMDGAMDTLKRDFSGLRTGRANPALLEPVKVEAYGTMMDRSMVNATVAAIRDCGLGLNPQPDGQMIRVPLPILTEERRNELAKAAGKYAEGARIAVRGVRRDGMETIKNLEKKSEIGEDQMRDWSDAVQKLTDAMIKRIDELLVEKDKDIRQV